ncbi:MAG: ATP-binding protein [Ardenticatenales bacterium]|nr:ATP-binding protein [Ardenticatenales bacterium]
MSRCRKPPLWLKQIRAGQLPILPRPSDGLNLQFVGRGPEHARLVRLLPQRRRPGRQDSTAPHLALLAGAAGIGKSTPALGVARYAASHGALVPEQPLPRFCGSSALHGPFVAPLLQRVGRSAAGAVGGNLATCPPGPALAGTRASGTSRSG